MADPNPMTPTALVLGRVPTGLYLVTTEQDGRPLGFVGSFLMQVGFAPPTVCVAVGRERAHLAAMRAAGRFGVSILDKSSEGLMRPFFRKHEGGAGPFDGLAPARSSGGMAVFDEALAWFECRLTGEHALGDHVVLFGEVVDAKLCREGEPSTRLRRNGLGY